jgi:hypothetical protein
MTRKSWGELSISAAARHLGLSQKWLRTLIERGFLKPPLSRARLDAGLKRYQADKARRATIREAPSAMRDALAFERVRSLELGNAIKRRDLVRLDHSLLGAEIVAGSLRSDAHALEGAAVASGADRHAVEDMTFAAMERASGRFGEISDALRALGVEEAAPTLPQPVPLSLKDRERAARVAKRKLANDHLEAAHIATSMAVAIIDRIVEETEQAFAEVPEAGTFVIDPLKARAAAVVECLRNGVDPETLT